MTGRATEDMDREKYMAGADAMSFLGTGVLKDKERSGLDVTVGNEKDIHQAQGSAK